MHNSIMLARTLLEQRASQQQLLGPLSSVAEPCWPILLQLFCTDQAQNCSITSIAELIGSSSSTAERYVRLLEEAGYVSLNATQDFNFALLEPATIQAINLALKEMRQRLCEQITC